MPTVSIIIPIYNAADYLQTCLESIAAQTYKDFEAILVDDGSTDGSRNICLDFQKKDPRFHYIYKENGGVSSARNAGLDMAKGEWITFVDADDWVTQDYLETVQDYSPQADITFFGETTISNNQEVQKTILPDRYCNERKAVEETIYELKCGKYGDVFGWTWDKIFRAEIIRQNNIRFQETIRFREDEIFTLEFCRYITSIRVSEKLLYFYRISNNGLTSKGLQKSDLLPSSIHLEESLRYYSHTALREHILKSVTDYRAMHIYASPFKNIIANLKEYQKLTIRYPQPGTECKVNHLTQYLRKSFWLGFLYCLIRKI